MIKDSDNAGRAEGVAGAAPGDEELSFTIELWDMRRERRERVLGRAASVVLARAIYVAALQEHLGRHIRLTRGDRVIEASD
jgi:hypothetical protein